MGKIKGLLAGACTLVLILFPSGCRTINDSTAEMRQLRSEMDRVRSSLMDDAQVLAYCARMTPDADLANMALNGVLAIIGQPDPQEKVYAVSLTHDDCADLVMMAENKVRELEMLQKRYDCLQERVFGDYSVLLRSHQRYGILKWIAGIALVVFLVGGGMRIWR